jgi:hypothetical protein
MDWMDRVLTFGVVIISILVTIALRALVTLASPALGSFVEDVVAFFVGE